MELLGLVGQLHLLFLIEEMMLLMVMDYGLLLDKVEIQ